MPNIEDLTKAYQKIAELEAQIVSLESDLELERATNDHHDEEVKDKNKLHESMIGFAEAKINHANKQIDELKSVVGCYRNSLRNIADLDSVRQDECSWMAEQALSALPAQCLASVKAQAITDAIFNSEQIDIDGHKYVGLEDLQVNISQLTEAK